MKLQCFHFLLYAHDLHVVFVTLAGVNPRLLHAEQVELYPHLLSCGNLQADQEATQKLVTKKTPKKPYLFTVRLSAPPTH